MADDWYKTEYENKHDSVNEFLQRKKDLGRSHRTLNEYSRVLKRFYHEHFPELTPEETTVRDIEEYLRILVERDLKQNTKRRYIESLSAFFSWAMKRPRYAEITGNPAAVVLEEIPKQINQRPDCATWENAVKIVRNINDPRDKTVALLLCKTGCRVTEALSIKENDLMLDEGFIRLRKRKGGSQTVIPIDDETVQAIQRFRFVDQSSSEFLFASYRTGGQLTRERIRRSVRGSAVESGVMKSGETRFHKKFTPHTFRTVFTTLMRNQGMPDHFLQYIRGDSEAETMDIYTRVDRDDAREAYLDRIRRIGI